MTVDGIDVPAIEARIARYQRENAEQIMNAQARKAEEYAAALAASKGQLPKTVADISSSSQSEKAARAGRWSIEMSKKRALEEAFASIWI